MDGKTPFSSEAEEDEEETSLLVDDCGVEWDDWRDSDECDGRAEAGKQGSNNAQQHMAAIPIVVTGLGAVVSAFKGVSTAALLEKQQQRFTPLQLLMLTAPVASLGCAVMGGVFTAEPRMLRELSWMDASHLLANGFLAFLLNWTGFAVNKETSALTITVAGNIKQALTVMIGILAFGVEMAWIGWLGIALTLFSGLAYG